MCRQSKPPPPLPFTIQGLEMQIAHMFTYISSLFSTEKKNYCNLIFGTEQKKRFVFFLHPQYNSLFTVRQILFFYVCKLFFAYNLNMVTPFSSHWLFVCLIYHYGFFFSFVHLIWLQFVRLFLCLFFVESIFSMVIEREFLISKIDQSQLELIDTLAGWLSNWLNRKRVYCCKSFFLNVIDQFYDCQQGTRMNKKKEKNSRFSKEILHC